MGSASGLTRITSHCQSMALARIPHWLQMYQCVQAWLHAAAAEVLLPKELKSLQGWRMNLPEKIQRRSLWRQPNQVAAMKPRSQELVRLEEHRTFLGMH